MDLITPYLLPTCVGILLGLAYGAYRNINKLFNRCDIQFDSIVTNHQRLDKIDEQIDKIYEHLSWHESKIIEHYPEPVSYTHL
tara:strand:+ start:338 stop:586 length:249 start_codon:yes stop_codon:yes gene_type:complete